MINTLTASGVGNNVVQFSNNTTNYLNTIPSIVNNWQAQDIANGDVGGYHVNPLANVILYIEATENQIVTVCSLITSLATISTTAVTAANSANNFFAHTQRLSGVVQVQNDLLVNLPHYDTAVQYGKTIIYLANKNNEAFGVNVNDNTPIIGNFTSLFTGNDLNNMAIMVTNDLHTIQHSITTSGGDYIVTTSNLTPTQISTITANLISISSFMDSRRSNDEIFFQTEQQIVLNFNSVRKYSNMGSTELYLINNFVGSDKLKQRINP